MWELFRSLVQARESTHAAYITSTTLLGCTVKRKNMLTFILFHTIYSQAIASDCCEMSEVVRCLVICADFCVWKSSVCNVERDMCIKKKEKSLKKLACIAQTLAVVGGVHRWSSNTQLSGDRQRTPEWNRFYVLFFLFTFSLGRHATPISRVVVCCLLVEFLLLPPSLSCHFDLNRI